MILNSMNYSSLQKKWITHALQAYIKKYKLIITKLDQSMFSKIIRLSRDNSLINERSAVWEFIEQINKRIKKVTF